MARLLSAAHSDVDDDDDFDAASQLAILRRAVAEVAMPSKTLPVRLSAIRAELRRFSLLAGMLLAQLGADELAVLAGDLSARLGRRLPTRSLLELVRHELYDCLVQASGDFVALERAPRGEVGALSLRTLLSDFHCALLPETEDSNVWALTVANAELGLLLRRPCLEGGPAPERARLTALGARMERWSARGRHAAGASVLYAEVTSTVDLLDGLNKRPEVRRHDERVLRDLSLVLSRGVHDLTLAACAADRLSALRGLDRELDRLIVRLPLEPVTTLGRIAGRVRTLSLSSLAS